jgi:serine/threonine protein kinase
MSNLLPWGGHHIPAGARPEGAPSRRGLGYSHPVPDPPPEVRARVGAVIAGRYRLVRVLGAGGMGAVYDAVHVELRKRVAVKVMLPQWVGHKEVVARFVREAHAAARLAHPNVVDVTDCGQDADGALYIAQELLAGRDLARLLEDEVSLQPSRALPLLVPALHALGYAHACGIVHRDLKPGNIFLADLADCSTAPKILDFGIAKECAMPVEELTRVGSVMGTPQYMAPEQVQHSDTARHTARVHTPSEAVAECAARWIRCSLALGSPGEPCHRPIDARAHAAQGWRRGIAAAARPHKRRRRLFRGVRRPVRAARRPPFASDARRPAVVRERVETPLEPSPASTPTVKPSQPLRTLHRSKARLHRPRV